MKYLKPWWSDGGDLLHLTVLLSLAGLHLDLDLDLYLLLPPTEICSWKYLRSPPLTAPSSLGTVFNAQLGFRNCPVITYFAALLSRTAGSSLCFLRHLWSCIGKDGIGHSVSVPDAGEAQVHTGVVLGSVAGGGGQSNKGSPRNRSSKPQALEEAEPRGAPSGAAFPAGASSQQENEVLRATGHSSQQEENEQGVSAQKDKSLQQQGEDETKTADVPEWEAEKTTDTRNERYLNGTDTSLSLEDLLQLLSSQPENSVEGISLGDIPLLPGSINDGMNSSAYYNVNFSQAISHDVNLHEAMLLYPDNTFRRDPVGRTSQPQEPFLQLNSHTTNPAQTLPGTNLTGFLPPVDHQIRNLTSHDLLYDLDINVFDEINSMSLATEGFDPMEVSHLFGEPDSDSGLSLNSSHNSTSVTNPNSCVCDSAIGSSSDLESLSHHALEGAVGGYYPEPSKIRHIDLSSDSTFHGDLAFQHIFHNHTYHLQSSVPESTSESFSWPGKSQKIKSRYLNDTDRNLSRDERRAKALHIPFSVDEIVHMPVDSFNSMLSRYYLTDLQVSLIRDIRRRGKNKVAAQNCRKRKLDIILNLEDDVCNLQAKKETLKSERAQCNKAINIMKQKLHDLYHDILSRLRDDEGRPVNPNQYALQCSHDGSVLIVPKELVTSGYKKETQKGKRKSERRN
uniref:Nuclear factor erythroid 2-related factor 3 n=1 Tax=Myotis lucifugus TaxID=59463 RepID=G1P9I2_MYOLU